MIHRPVLAILLPLLALACDGGDSPAPSATAPTAPDTRRTATPERTAAAAPSLTPSQRATSAASPAATATTTDTPGPRATATPRSDGLEFHFGPGVSDFDRSLIMRAVEVTGELLSAGAEVRPPAAVFAATTSLRLEQMFRDEALEQRWRSEGMAQRMAQAVAEASYRGIVINTGSAAWGEMDSTERLRAVAHEFVHVIQLEQSGERAADGTLSGSVNQIPPIGPFWLLEGSAEVVSWMVLEELGLGSYPEPLFDYAADAGGTQLKLEELSSFIGYRGGGSEGLGLAVLAVDYLLRSRSLDALFDFWREVGGGADWTTAFTREFGQPPAFFYVSFAAFYEATWAGFQP